MKQDNQMQYMKCKICGKSIRKIDAENHLLAFHSVDMIPDPPNKPKTMVQPKTKSKQPIIVDGTNVAYATGEPSISNIKKVRISLVKLGFQPIIFVSNALRYKIDQPNELQRLINIGWIIETQGDRDDDLDIIEEAIGKNASIVSNDRFAQHRETYAEKFDFNSRLVPFNLQKEVVFENLPKH